MKIGQYTFEEFKQKAAEFHGYPAPGIMLGGYMVELAKRHLPEGTLFEALVESKKCLPDAVQLLTLCSTGNGWMRVLDLGRYALSLYDKRTGEGVRVGLIPEKLREYPELNAWFMKLKPKKNQDSDLLMREIEIAGDSVCSLIPIRVQERFLGKGPSGPIAVCPICNEPFPALDGLICRGCQGENPYSNEIALSTAPTVSVLPVEEAVGKTILHDMTEVIPGESKGAAFTAGQVIGAGDVCRLQKMGRFSVAVTAETPAGFIHENDGAEAFARRMAGDGLEYSLPPREGKINFRARQTGLFTLDRARLLAFNLLPDVMCATRQDGALVQAGTEVAGTRVIPLYISRERFAAALEILGNKPLFSIASLRRAKVGILVTGSEVFQGLIEDKFIPLVSAKVKRLGCTVVKTVITPDESAAIRQGIAEIREAGADLLITTGGMSVDPGDITRAALVDAGIQAMLYSAPVLPGTMSLVGLLPGQNDSSELEAGAMQVIGVPACALFHKITLFDALLPRLLAGRQLTRQDLAGLGEGGFCANCPVCTWPKCSFLA
ncbi:MAG: FmdE family protein [Deltaproteobacteria bacterium]|jgi:formylmethanofuran dehydrogenase subunit E|nr:FmdE family protein [Deltaproteobacteria bacterium]